MSVIHRRATTPGALRGCNTCLLRSGSPVSAPLWRGRSREPGNGKLMIRGPWSLLVAMVACLPLACVLVAGEAIAQDDVDMTFSGKSGFSNFLESSHRQEMEAFS